MNVIRCGGKYLSRLPDAGVGAAFSWAPVHAVRFASVDEALSALWARVATDRSFATAIVDGMAVVFYGDARCEIVGDPMGSKW